MVAPEGTIETNPHDLIVPTSKAFTGRDDVLVVAILGWKGGKLSEFVEVPAMARMADHLPCDAVLKHADLWGPQCRLWGDKPRHRSWCTDGGGYRGIGRDGEFEKSPLVGN